MIDRSALHDYQNSRAVLIGASTYRNLNPVPAARSLHRLRDLLTSDLCGWPDGKITVIEEPEKPGDLRLQLIEAFHEVKDVALFYFVGHGLPDEQDQLCLGLVESDNRPHLRGATSMEFRHVRDALIGSGAETRLLILDCCFAGLANQRQNTLGASELAEQAHVAGAYTMAACQPYGTASFESDGPDPQTHFTKYLVDLIEEGIPGPSAELRLRPIFRRLSDRLTADGHPRPMERNIDSAGDFAFAYNAAPVQVQVDVPTALQRMDDRLSRMEGYFAALAQPTGLSTGAQPTVSPSEAMRPDPVRPPDGPVTRVAALRAQAAEFLRLKNGVGFRAIEDQLQELGASARPTAVLQTSLGSITIRLFPDYAPEAVRNFVELAQGTRPWIDPRAPAPFRRGVRFYDGTLFHRVVRGLLIQGGDPTGTGSGGPGYRQPNEFHPDLTFDRPYLVAMANSGESSSNGSQFFITVSPTPWLNGKHTIFGEVTDNDTVAVQISLVPVDAEDRPIEDVVLESVSINPVGLGQRPSRSPSVSR